MKARIKGTDIIVECKGIGTILGNEGSGIECRYLTGEHKGASETIPGDCLVEMDGDLNWRELHASMVANFTVASLARMGGMPADEDTRRLIVNAAFDMADDIEKRLRNRKEG
jgi:hypothetical protein